MRCITLNHGVIRTLMKTASFPGNITAVALHVLGDVCGRVRSNVCPKLSNRKNNQASGKTREIMLLLLADCVPNMKKLLSQAVYRGTKTKSQTNLKFAANMVLKKAACSRCILSFAAYNIPQFCVTFRWSCTEYTPYVLYTVYLIVFHFY